MSQGEETDSANSSPVLIVEGDRVALGPLSRDLVPLYHRWESDLMIARNMAKSKASTIEGVYAVYDAATTATDIAAFTIYERDTARPIGICNLTGIDHWNRCASFAIVIGESDCRGKGYGTEATRLILDYAFTVLGLNNVELSCRAHNVAGLRAYQKAGFKEIGRRRACRMLNGELWDNVLMDCVAAEFESPVLARLITAGTPVMPASSSAE